MKNRKDHNDRDNMPESCNRRNFIRIGAKTTLMAAAMTQFCGTLNAAENIAGVRKEGVDRIYLNGRVYTVDFDQEWAEAFAIKDGKFLAVGSNDDIEKLRNPSTEVIDLQGSFVMPGMVEEHIHPDMLAENKMNIEIPAPETTYQEFSGMVLAFLQENPDSKWVFGGPMNWLKDHAGNIDVWNKPSHYKILDEIVNDRPAFFWDMGGHAALVNSYAMKKYGINKDNKPPVGGSWDYDKDGNLTGVLREIAANVVWEEFLKDRESPEVQAMKGFLPVFKELNRYGFTSISDVWARPWNIDAYQVLENKGLLSARMTVYITDPVDWVSDELKAAAAESIAKGPRKLSSQINIIGVKFVLDGSAGGQTIVMSEPFVGTDNHGYFRTDPEYFLKGIVEYDKMGYTVRAHAVGDKTISTVLDGIELTRKNGSKLRHSTAHTVFVNPKEYDRFKELDVSADMSPYFWFPDPAIETIRADVGDERLKWIWPFRALQDRGVHMSTGSDAPVAPIPPFGPMEAMITRQLPGGAGTSLNAKDHAIDIKDALYIFTMGGAYNQYKENEIGSITQGKYADFIVLDQNLVEIEPTKIHKTKVLLTALGGKEIYRHYSVSEKDHPAPAYRGDMHH